MKLENKILKNGDLELKITLDTHDQICLQHDLPGVQGIIDWYANGPTKEKIQSCQKRMIRENKELLMKDDSIKDLKLQEVNQILEDHKGACELISKMPSYKNRIQRDNLIRI